MSVLYPAFDTKTLKQQAPDLLSLAQGLTSLKKVAAANGGEYAGPCPFCPDHGADRFHVQPYARPEPRWLCRQCTDGKWQDVISFVSRRDNVNFLGACKALFGNDVIIADPGLVQRIKAERDAREAKEKAEELQRQAERRQQLDQSNAWLAYWENLNKYPNTRKLWEKRGLSTPWQDYFKVGFCPQREFFHDEKAFTSPTLTIPTFSTRLNPDPAEPCNFWRCEALVHRLLISDPPGGKYRPELSGAGKPLFCTDLFDPGIHGPVLLVEGEIKAMVTYASLQDIHPLHSYLRRLTVVGTAGKNFKPEHAGEFQAADKIWICLDPDANKAAANIAALLGKERCRIIHLPGHIDDMLNAGALTTADIGRLLRTARGVL